MISQVMPSIYIIIVRDLLPFFYSPMKKILFKRIRFPIEILPSLPGSWPRRRPYCSAAALSLIGISSPLPVDTRLQKSR